MQKNHCKRHKCSGACKNPEEPRLLGDAKPDLRQGVQLFVAKGFASKTLGALEAGQTDAHD